MRVIILKSVNEYIALYPCNPLCIEHDTKEL